MRIAAIAFVSFALLASCGPSLQSTCEDFATAWCDQHYNCSTGDTLANLQAQYGQTAAECASTYANNVARCESNATIIPCGVGTSYDSSAADACAKTYGAQSCTVTTDPNFTLSQLPGCADTDICH